MMNLKNVKKNPPKEKGNVKEKKKLKVEKRVPSKEELKFKKQFYELMFEMELYNKFKKTYKLNILKETNYGYYAHLYLAQGLSFDKLLKEKITIEQNLKCMWIMNVEQFKEYAEVQIVLNPVDKNMEFKNPNIKPYELYLGLSFSNQIQKINMNEYCMFLLAGATGNGKTRFIYQILLSWILGCSPDEIWIYLSDIAKNEYIQFEGVRHVKYYASELDELFSMTNIITKELERRKNLITQYRKRGLATNIEEYNKINKSNKLAYCVLIVDEFSVLLPDKTDSKFEKEQKEYILAVLKRLSKTGRSLGIFTFIATQKTTKEEIPPILKNMSAVRISFGANDSVSSEVIMGSNIAMGLPTRVAVYSVNGGTNVNYLYSPNLITEKGKLKGLLEPHINKKTTNNICTSTTNNNVDNPDDNSVWKITRIPKGIDGREYIKSLKNKKKALLDEEDDYIDYGS